MTSKAYIVANEQQEREVLEKLEREGYQWVDHYKPTYFTPRKYHYVVFPYAIITNDFIGWLQIVDAILENYEIVYDGRKEEQMSDKYVVSQEFMDKLEEWKEILRLDNVLFIGRKALSNLPNLLDKWWRDGRVSVHESNNRLIAIIRWVNGEDAFEVKPKKWVVRSDSKDSEGDYWYVRLDGNEHNKSNVGYDIETATRFDTKEEAQSWANSHQEVVEVED